jgi:hypothetical protein
LQKWEKSQNFKIFFVKNRGTPASKKFFQTQIRAQHPKKQSYIRNQRIWTQNSRENGKMLKKAKNAPKSKKSIF